MRRLLFISVIASVLFLCGFAAKSVSADAGSPGSAEFGVGAAIDDASTVTKEGLLLARNIPLDWVLYEFNWSAAQPDPQSGIDWSFADKVIPFAASIRQPIVLSLQTPPAWAITANGPDVASAVAMVQQIMARYPGEIQALEVFPGANSPQKWGALPSAPAYLALHHAIAAAVSGQPIHIIAGSLLIPAGENGVDAPAFLQQIYTLEADPGFSILGLRYAQLSGEPSSSPDLVSPTLRVYDLVRQVMVANQQAESRIWVLQIAAPSGTINAQGDAAQTDWMLKAITQLRSQLFVGVVFIGKLTTAPETNHLISEQRQPSVFLTRFEELISQWTGNQSASITGRYKNGLINKSRPVTLQP